jgi:peptidoglycan/LPS O-acetylase OafA/YrhL
MALAVVSVAVHGRERSNPVLRFIDDRPWLPWLGAAFVFWLVSTQLGLSRGFFFVYTDLNYLGEHLLYALTGLLLLLPAIFGSGGWVRRLLAWPVLAWLGLISYGIFLYHGPLVLWLAEQDADTWIPGSGYLSMLSVAVVMAVACAAASYYLLERPILGFKDRRRRSASRASEPEATAASARQAAGLSGSASTASRASGSA